ncbi:MAG: serine hydrolase [Aureispira sp.]
MRFYSFCVLLLLLVVTSCTDTPKVPLDNGTTQTQQLDSLFQFSYSNGLFNGAILITKNNTVLYKNAFGYANEETKTRINTESVFYIASVSKQFTAMGIMLLQEKGKLSLEDKINDFFPDYPDYLQEVSIRQLLNHTSGITDAAYYKLVHPSNKEVLDALFQQDTLSLKNGTTFHYSNSGYVMLALIIQKVSGQTIDQFFHQEIFEPLAMKNTTTSLQVEKIVNKVAGYNLFGKKVDYKSSVIGPGGIYSTLEDLGKWNQALNTYRLVSKTTLQEAFTNGKLQDGPISITIGRQKYGYGFGWMVFSKDGKQYVQHDGTVESYRSLIHKDLTEGYDYIFLTNQGSRLAMNELITAIDLILNHSKYEVPKIPITNKIVKEVGEQTLEKAFVNIQTALKQHPTDYNITENVINRLAYTYLRDTQFKIAIEVFKLNVSLYPTSANAFDSLGEGYFYDKQMNLAKENFQKSIALDPSNKNAQAMFKRIEQGE